MEEDIVMFNKVKMTLGLVFHKQTMVTFSAVDTVALNIYTIVW